MKKILKTGTLAMAVSLAAFTTSCGDFLDITPLNAVVVENYWEKKSEVESVITSCYFHMQDKGFSQRVIAWGELRGDNLTETSTMAAKEKELYDFYTNNIVPDNSWTSWADFYNVINLCNTILHYAPGAQAKDGNYSVDELRTHEAEAKSIRALCYFYLIRTFKKVPLVLQATIGDDVDFKVRASSEQDVLEQIIADLEWSEDYIWNKKFFDDERERKGRFNKLSVKALWQIFTCGKGIMPSARNIARKSWMRKWQSTMSSKQQNWREILYLLLRKALWPCTMAIRFWMNLIHRIILIPCCMSGVIHLKVFLSFNTIMITVRMAMKVFLISTEIIKTFQAGSMQRLI